MTITLSPEQEKLLSEVVQAGLAHTPEEAIDKAVRALYSSAARPALTTRTPFHPQADNLADLFAHSPFRGLNMIFERDKDTGRDIAL